MEPLEISPTVFQVEYLLVWGLRELKSLESSENPALDLVWVFRMASAEQQAT